ncbi:MAG: class I SAM-dependent methyltransferase, partial [Steroidobacteraceae bacterium]
AINGPQRTPAFVKRDKYRHPLQTLEFFGIRPDMRVVEVLPAPGWYAEILAPFLRAHGQLIEATQPVAGSTGYAHRSAVAYYHKLAADPAVYGKVRLEPFELEDNLYLGAPDSADMVVTFRNMHDLMVQNVHHEESDHFLMVFLRNAYHVLKPGGILGIVAHRANPNMPLQKCFELTRLPEPFLIHEAERAGFRFGGSSEINANPKDPRTAPVFFFPPTLAKASGDPAHYKTLGEADNMTLRFIKPLG